MIEAVAGASRIYLDANCIIYFVERSDQLQAKVAEVIQFSVNNEIRLFCSEIGVAECFHGAFKAKSVLLEDIYKELFYDIALFEITKVTGEVLLNAARIGTEKGLKLVDATHFLAAMEMECSVMITNDRRFGTSHGVQVYQLADL